MRAATTIAATTLLIGCATAPVATEDAREVSEDRIYARLLVSDQSGKGMVLVKRDSGLYRSACTYRLYVDGQHAADFWRAEKLSLFLDPGDRILSVRPVGLCRSSLVVETLVRVGEKANHTYRIGAIGDSLVIQPTAF